MANKQYKLFRRNQIGRAQKLMRDRFAEELTIMCIAKTAGASLDLPH